MNFAYLDKEGKEYPVTTLEQAEYPQYYFKNGEEAQNHETSFDIEIEAATEGQDKRQKEQTPEAKEGHVAYKENQKGISYQLLFGEYLKDATSITITDPYIKLFYQIRNLMELIEVIVENKSPETEVSIHLVTVEDEFKGEQQTEQLQKIQLASESAGAKFSWKYEDAGAIHTRHIITDIGWKISLDRGLDIFQHYEMNDTFSFANRLQKFR